MIAPLPETRIRGPGTRIRGPGTRIRGPGTRIRTHGTRIRGPGTRIRGPVFVLSLVVPLPHRVITKMTRVGLLLYPGFGLALSEWEQWRIGLCLLGAAVYIRGNDLVRPRWVIQAVTQQGSPHLHPPGFCISVFCRPLSVHTIAQSLTQKHRQTLFYKVKYDIRCGCSKVDTRQICLQPLINLWVCTPLEKILRAPMSRIESYCG